MLSGAIASCIGNPFEVAIAKMLVDLKSPPAETKHYGNVFNTMLRVSVEEGPAKLFSGIVPNICRGVCLSVAMLACYDEVTYLHYTILFKNALLLN